MTTQDVLELLRAGWSRDEILTLMRADRQASQQTPQQVQPQQEPPQQVQPQQEQQVQQAAQQAPQEAPQQAVQQAPQQAVQQVQPQQVQQESETVQLLREMLGMIRGNNINTMGGESRSVDAAEILAANDYGFDKGGKT